MTSLRGHFWSREVMWAISCHVMDTSCTLQPCKSSNVPKNLFICLLQPLPGDFRSNNVTSGWLPVMWGHVLSFPVTWLSYLKLELYAFSSHFQVSYGEMTSLPGHFRSREVTLRHFLSSDGHLRVTAMQELKRTQNWTYTPSTATPRWLSVKWRHFRVSSGHVRSRDVISCNVTATSCDLKPCKSSNVPKTRPIRLLQPLSDDFRSNDVTSGSLPVTWGHVNLFPVS